MGIYSKIKRAIACLLIQKKIAINLSEPIISFTFDDVPNSALINGEDILSKYGYQGTYYISLGLMDKTTPNGGYCDPVYLNKIIKNGGELACHTFNHIRLYSSSKEQILLDLEKNKKKIDEIIPGYSFSNFSYPYGEQTMTSKIIIRDKYKSARSIKSGINSGAIDLNNLKAVMLTDDVKPEDIFAMIEKTIKSNGWLIFFTHNVETPVLPYGCSPNYFETITKYCFEKKINVLTIEKAVNKITSK